VGERGDRCEGIRRNYHVLGSKDIFYFLRALRKLISHQNPIVSFGDTNTENLITLETGKRGQPGRFKML
jgi:hypothetical protein